MAIMSIIFKILVIGVGPILIFAFDSGEKANDDYAYEKQCPQRLNDQPPRTCKESYRVFVNKAGAGDKGDGDWRKQSDRHPYRPWLVGVMAPSPCQCHRFADKGKKRQEKQ